MRRELAGPLAPRGCDERCGDAAGVRGLVLRFGEVGAKERRDRRALPLIFGWAMALCSCSWRIASAALVKDFRCRRPRRLRQSAK